MIIQHNIMAINSHRQLGINNKNLSNNLEKLSSGYRINRAADDAAGLAISEKMRAQITGIDRAVLNAQDGASLIQTAEGALTEVHSMLNRMVELATQSANGTIQADDRQKIEAETTALKEEIDRISKATNFNGIQLLDGSLSTSGVTEVAINGINTTLTAATAGTFAITVGAGAAAAAAGDVVTYTLSTNDNTSVTMSFTVNAARDKMVASDGSEYSITAGAVSGAQMADAVNGQLSKDKTFMSKFDITHAGGTAGITFTAKEAGTAAAKIAGGAAFVGATAAAATTMAATSGTDSFKTGELTSFTGANEASAVFSVNGVKFALADTAANAQLLKDKGVNILIESGTLATDTENMAALINQKTGLEVKSTATGVEFRQMANTGKGLTMQVGDTSADFNKITVSVDDMSSVGLGVAGISMATQDSASAALDAVKLAIEKVSVNRGNLGALQNRLDHTINNLNVTSENMTAAESRIRDVDMAKEMMAFTKNNVLAQAAQGMLAQANMQPQQVLQLLR